MGRAATTALFGGDLEVADILPAPDDLGGRGRFRLCEPFKRLGVGGDGVVTETGRKLLRAHGRLS
jgi:hypothetical protein